MLARRDVPAFFLRQDRIGQREREAGAGRRKAGREAEQQRREERARAQEERGERHRQLADVWNPSLSPRLTAVFTAHGGGCGGNPGQPGCPCLYNATTAAPATDETAILLTLPLFVAIDTPAKGRGGCIRMREVAPMARPLG